MSEAPFVSEDLAEEEFERRLAQKRNQRIEGVGKEGLLWLALVPYWTVPQAKACGFPVNNLEGFIEQAQAAGLCETSVERGYREEEIVNFWMPSTMASAQIEDARGERGVSSIRGVIIEIAGRLWKISDSKASGQELAPSVQRWMELAYEYRRGGEFAARKLTKTTQDLISQGKTGDALAWTDTGSILARILGGDMETAVLTATRQIELAYRNNQDQRYLEGYLRIDDQVEAFETLISARDNDPWALHYIGMGGVGKTMLIRYLSYQFAEKVTTARVDFDYLSPEFPVRQPGILLTYFASEFKLNFTSRQELNRFDELYALVETLHGDLREGKFGGDWRATLASPDFEKILHAFASILRNIMTRLGRPPVLILDTCEELVKLQPANGKLPNLEATFMILQRLHELSPALRVVFAGRRPLALAGPGWSVTPNLLSYLPKEKDYLRLHLLRGFTLDQARTYLSQNKQLVLSPEMEATVLEKSFETGDPGDIHLPQTAPEKRYNPFDLSLYAGWIKEDPRLSPEKIRQGGADPYIKLRIIERIHNDALCRLLPAVALLGSFTADMLRPLLALHDAAYRDVFWQLSEQEWINPVRSEYGRRKEVIQVESNLLPRLQQFFRGPDWKKTNEDTHCVLGPHLDQMVRALSLSELSPVQVMPALLLQEAGGAALLWEAIGAKIEQEANWNWGLNVAGQLLGMDAPAGSLRHPIYAALKSTQIAAQIHLSDQYDAYEDWADVESALEIYPNPAKRECLAALTLAGKLASIRWRERPLPEAWVQVFTRRLEELLLAGSAEGSQDEQLAAGLVSGVDGLLDWFEAHERECADETIRFIRTGGWQDQLTGWAMEGHGLPDEIRAFALIQAGRALALAGQIERAGEVFHAAEILALALSQEPSRQVWSFWRAPRFLVDRVRLEWLRQLDITLLQRDGRHLGEWLKEALPRRNTIDANRLISALLQYLPAEQRKVANQLIMEADRDPAYSQELQPECLAHRKVSPLWAGQALCMLRVGMDREASWLLDRCIRQARESKDSLSELAGNRDLLKVIRRARRYERGESGLVRLAGNLDLEDIQAAWPAQALAMPPNPGAIPEPDPGDSPERLFVWWDCQASALEDQNHKIFNRMMGLLDQSKNKTELSRVGQMQLAVMRYEATQIKEDQSQREDEVVRRLSRSAEKSGFSQYEALFRVLAASGAEICPFEAEAYAGLLMRVVALNPGLQKPISLEQEINQLLKDLSSPSNANRSLLAGVSAFLRVDSQAALKALEIGELLALRQPAAGARLLDFAIRRFEAAGDPLAAWSAGVLAVLAYLRLGKIIQAKNMLDEHIQPNYIQTQKDRVALPEWQVLSAAAHSDAPVALDALDQSAYAGLLHRLLAGMAVLQALLPVSPRGSREDTARAALEATLLFTWLGERYGGALPVELALMVEGVKPKLAQLAAQAGGFLEMQPKLEGISTRPVPDAKKKEPNYLLIGLIGGMLSLAIVMGLILVAYGWVVVLTTQVLSRQLGVLPQLGVFAGLLGLLYLIPAWIVSLFRWVRSQIAAASRVAMALRQEGQALQDGVQTATLQVNLQRSRLRLGRPFLQYSEPVSGAGVVRSGLPYNTQGKDLEFPKSVAGPLTKLKAALGGRAVIATPLLVDPALDSEAWEALLQMKLHSRNGTRISIPLAFWRTKIAGSRPRLPEQAWKTGQVAIFTSPSWELLAEESWKSIGRPVIIFTDVRRLAADVSFKVLHLIGAPTSTGSGKFFQTARGDYMAQEQARREGSMTKILITQGASKPSQGDPNLSFSSGGPAQTSSRSGQSMLGLEQIPVARAALTIVQGEPAEVFQRTGADWGTMRELRKFGADLFAAGAPAVLVLPVLPSDLAKAVIQHLAKELARLDEIDGDRLAKIAARIQKIIVRWNPQADTASFAEAQKINAIERMDTRLEQAFDITLFVAEEFDPQRAAFLNQLLGGTNGRSGDKHNQENK